MRNTLVLAGLALLLVACGETKQVEVVVESPTEEASTLPFGMGVIEGRLENADVLRVRLTRGDEIFTFDASEGWRLAMRGGVASAEALPPPGASAPATPGTPASRFEDPELGVEIEPGPDPSAFVLKVPGPGDVRRVASMAGQGADVWFAVEVRPTDQYRAYDDDEPAPRLKDDPPWSASAEAFRRWKEAEVERWKAARKAAARYEPSRPGLRVVPKGSAARDAPDEPDDFAVLAWTDADTFHCTADVIVDPAVGQGQAGQPVVLYGIRAEAQDRFEAMTRRNLGLPMAIVVDGRFKSAPTILSPLRDNVQITLGSGKSYAEVMREGEALVGGLRLGLQDLRLEACAHVDLQGRFRVLVNPLGGDVKVGLIAVGRKGTGAEEALRTFHVRPGTDPVAAVAAPAVRAALRLGQLDAEKAAALLRPLRDEVAPLLAADLDELPPGDRARLVELLGRLDQLALVLDVAPQDESEEVRIAAARVMSPGADVERLRAWIEKEKSEAVAEALARRLTTFDAGAVLLVPDLLRLAARLEGRGASMVPHLVSRLLPEAREAVWSAAAAEDAALRAAAIKALAGDVDERTRALLLKALGDADERVREAALSVLASRIVFAAEGASADEPPSTFNTPEVIQALAGLLEAADRPARGTIVMLLALLGQDGQAELLRRLVAESPLEPLPVLAFLLTDRQNKRWDVAADARVDAVMEHMNASEDLMSRALGAYLGMERGGDEAPMVAVLAELEEADEFEHRLLGAIAMQILDKQDAVPRLRKLLDDDSPEVRRTAAIVLQHYFEVSDERIRRELEAGEPPER